MINHAGFSRKRSDRLWQRYKWNCEGSKMEKEIKEAVRRIETTHEFYCDECGEYLGRSEEYEDGYYYKIGEYQWKYYDKNCGWLYKKGNYCPKCQERVAEQIASALKKMGFIAGDNF